MNLIRKLLLNNVFIIWLIIVNSIVIFIQGFDLPISTKNIVVNLDNIFTMVFVLEMVVKIQTFGLKGYVSSRWNVFDGTLVLLALPSLLYWSVGNEVQLEFLLVLRIARIFKFFRFIRFFPGINSLIAGVQKALKASVIVLLGFLVFIFIISVVSCFAFKNISPVYFGDPMKSLYTIFRVFTVEGWYEIPDDVAANLGSLTAALIKFYFIIILVCGGIFGLSLVNSIFVDAMVSDNNDELLAKVERLERKIDQLINHNKTI